jgi:nitrogen fixation-related uncharacterized protein
MRSLVVAALAVGRGAALAQGPPWPMLVGMALWLGAVGAAAVWWARAQTAYLDQYRVHDPSLPRNEDLTARYEREPWRWPIEAPGVVRRLWRISTGP